MITIHVNAAKRRFSRRKQWQFAITSGNNEPIDPRDTYANVGDIHSIWERILDTAEPVQMITHYQAGPKTIVLRAAP